MLCVPGLCKPRDQLLCVRLSFGIHARMASFLYQVFLLVANCVHNRFIQVQVTFILVGHPLWFPGDMVGALHLLHEICFVNFICVNCYCASMRYHVTYMKCVVLKMYAIGF